MSAADETSTPEPVQSSLRVATSAAAPVIYRRQDYVGFLRRLLIIAVDGIVIWLWGAFLWIVGTVSPDAQGWPLTLVLVIGAWAYLAVLKPSRIRSLGYWVADARIVTLRGERPSPWRMTLRLIWIPMWMIGWPIGWPQELAWPFMDRDRQLLRDLLAGTRVIRNQAQPMATGHISSIAVFAFGLSLRYFEVRPNSPCSVPVTGTNSPLNG